VWVGPVGPLEWLSQHVPQAPLGTLYPNDDDTRCALDALRTYSIAPHPDMVNRLVAWLRLHILTLAQGTGSSSVRWMWPTVIFLWCCEGVGLPALASSDTETFEDLLAQLKLPPWLKRAVPFPQWRTGRGALTPGKGYACMRAAGHDSDRQAIEALSLFPALQSGVTDHLGRMASFVSRNGDRASGAATASSAGGNTTRLPVVTDMQASGSTARSNTPTAHTASPPPPSSSEGGRTCPRVAVDPAAAGAVTVTASAGIASNPVTGSTVAMAGSAPADAGSACTGGSGSAPRAAQAAAAPIGFVPVLVRHPTGTTNLNRSSKRKATGNPARSLRPRMHSSSLTVRCPSPPLDGPAASPAQPTPAPVGSLPLVDTFLRRVTCTEWGVLGKQLCDGVEIIRRPAAPCDTLIVDPCGLNIVRSACPSAATGASGAIYRHVGLGPAVNFPNAVSTALQGNGDTVGYDYGDTHVLHVAVPDLAQHSERTSAVAALATCYQRILTAFASTSMQVLRLPPLAGQAYVGQFSDSIHAITVDALKAGFLLLARDLQERCVHERAVELCIYTQHAHRCYATALRVGGGRRKVRIRRSNFHVPASPTGPDSRGGVCVGGTSCAPIHNSGGTEPSPPPVPLQPYRVSGCALVWLAGPRSGGTVVTPITGVGSPEIMSSPSDIVPNACAASSIGQLLRSIGNVAHDDFLPGRAAVAYRSITGDLRGYPPYHGHLVDHDCHAPT